ncbi:hypothetical protein XELAEV_18026554mg [Xenopus laevis]|uniref:Uncharacterized protein n=1 Tax=Xenopus laevis TaxID=8355 RepID=A0A974HIY4_XENLA|nr:hypothetical protein XELAEV_18026554mg [Xenopus laevis]
MIKMLNNEGMPEKEKAYLAHPASKWQNPMPGWCDLTGTEGIFSGRKAKRYLNFMKRFESVIGDQYCHTPLKRKDEGCLSLTPRTENGSSFILDHKANACQHT